MRKKVEKKLIGSFWDTFCFDQVKPSLRLMIMSIHRGEKFIENKLKLVFLNARNNFILVYTGFYDTFEYKELSYSHSYNIILDF